MANREITNQSNYADKLFALIPAEVSAAFLAIHTIVDPSSTKHNALIIFSAVVLLVFNVLYLKRFQNVSDVSQLAFTTGAFVLWVCSIETNRLLHFGIEPTYIAVALILYTLGAPFCVKTPNP